LSDLEGEKAIPDILTSLGDRSLDVQVGASDALVRLGVRAFLLPERSRLHAENREVLDRFIGLHPDQRPVRTVRDLIREVSRELAAGVAEKSNLELIEWALDTSLHLHTRNSAIVTLMERGAREAVPDLRYLLEDPLVREHALEALDRIDPEWDRPLRGQASELMVILAGELALDARRGPARDIARQLLENFFGPRRGGMENLALAMGLGGSAAWLGESSLARALVQGAAPPGVLENFPLLGATLLLGSGILLGMSASSASRPRREALPIHRRPTALLDGRQRPSEPAPEGPTLGHFEYVYDPAERVAVPLLDANAVVNVGRATEMVTGIFPSHFRNISRNHFDMRVRDGQVEIRLNERARGVRINQVNLLPNQWYLLRDGDLLELTGEARLDSVQWQHDPESLDLVETPFR
ncbi:MAG: hypothetical protein ACREP8_02185, partial [Candidatus Binatia bacterium]